MFQILGDDVIKMNEIPVDNNIKILSSQEINICTNDNEKRSLIPTQLCF